MWSFRECIGVVQLGVVEDKSSVGAHKLIVRVDSRAGVHRRNQRKMIRRRRADYDVLLDSFEFLRWVFDFGLCTVVKTNSECFGKNGWWTGDQDFEEPIAIQNDAPRNFAVKTRARKITVRETLESQQLPTISMSSA